MRNDEKGVVIKTNTEVNLRGSKGVSNAKLRRKHLEGKNKCAFTSESPGVFFVD